MSSYKIVCSTIPEREGLLFRSIQTWYRSADLINGDVDVIVYAEGHTPVLPLPRQDENSSLTVYGGIPRSGDKNTGYNWIVENELGCGSPCIIFTHPEILFPIGLVSEAIRLVEQHGRDKTVHFKGYRLSREMTGSIYRYPWQTPELIEQEHLDALTTPSAYEQSAWADNANVRHRTNWPGTITFACNAGIAKKLYPMHVFGWVGPDDMFFMKKKGQLGIGTHTAMESVVYHQYHGREANTNDLERRQQAVRKAWEEEYGKS